MGLDTLDEFSPKDTDPVSLGDDAIRLTRAATKQTVGLEHYLDGPHKIPSGTAAVRPAAGRVGRLYFDTDTNALEYDNGSAWIAFVSRRAAATILSHAAEININPGATHFEIPFDQVLGDPGGYSSTQYHQIVMPTNSICSVSTYLEYSGNVGGGFGVFTYIEQYDGTNWQTLASTWVGPLQAIYHANISTVAHSNWGANLRITVTNASPIPMSLFQTAMGASPRFSMNVLGAAS